MVSGPGPSEEDLIAELMDELGVSTSCPERSMRVSQLWIQDEVRLEAECVASEESDMASLEARLAKLVRGVTVAVCA